jgi:CRISPR/Cas system CSM-associated protein Csm3 (group 7 of RAMP superfamily)
MHKATFLEGTLRFTIAPDGPILVKAGESSGVDPTLPDMRFVRSQGQIYIPGPSLKGVVRAQAERICRSLDSGDRQQQKLAARQELDQRDWAAIVQREKEQALAAKRAEPSEEELARKRIAPDQRVPLADNPLGSGTKYSNLDDMDYSSGRAIEAMQLPSGPERTAIVYRRSSFVSQIFGHTSLAGRVRFADAYSDDMRLEYLEERNGVAIDRIYGSVAVGPFNYEVVVGGTFASRIDFKNLTLAQLALLGLSLRDLAEGRVGIGFGKSRGLGRVRVTFDQMHISYPTCGLHGGVLMPLNGAAPIAKDCLAGLGALCTDAAYAAYALPESDQADLQGITYYAEPLKEEPQPENDSAERNPFRSLGDGLHCLPDSFLGVHLVARGNEAVRSIWKACMQAWRREIGL